MDPCNRACTDKLKSMFRKAGFAQQTRHFTVELGSSVHDAECDLFGPVGPPTRRWRLRVRREANKAGRQADQSLDR